LSLCHPLIEQAFPSFHVRSASEGVERLLADPNAGRGNTELGAQLIQRMVATSFPGLVSDPLSHPACLDRDNVRAVAKSLLRAVPDARGTAQALLDV
jgi:hypothetical protein